MYRVVLGKVSTLSAGQLPDALLRRRRAFAVSWLAGRVLKAPVRPRRYREMVYGEQGKPAFSAERRCGGF